MNTTLIKQKSNPNEQIDIGDIIMINPTDGKVTRGVLDDNKENDKRIIGICTKSDNEKQILLDGGNSNIGESNIIDGGTSNIEESTKIDTKDSNIQYNIEIATTGKQVVNIQNYSNIYDEVTLSKVPGRGQSKDYELRDLCSIGHIVQFLDNESQVKVDLQLGGR